MSILTAEIRQPNTHTSAAKGAVRLYELVTMRVMQESAGRLGQAHVLRNHALMRTAILQRPSWLPQPRPGACFANGVAAVSRPQARDLMYVEGYAYLAGIDVAFEHAWLEDEVGNVLETTWKSPAQAYFGIPMALETLHDLAFADDRESFLFGDWVRGFPVLRSHARCCNMPWFVAA